ncbi:penicillin acylase family protein [Hoeflea prorocentri]|uniref:Penicillin acylase family protein n=1 Tax=Hoeflea prorocentri TaxID=1922333 RepID=A0A9X3UG76_9HYPH|nr:penicillin acylase family protein [Hoeflea prorocentri]MCY6380275.1 penicillin acylase family protein [Hoeflea prorocentri]MDA5398075.1 penicillin acylase family protein [Hoeflea prorocentri]
MRRIIKVLVRFIFIAIPLLIVAAGGGYLWMARSLPPVSGSMTVEQLSDTVTVARDENGVPHITGTSIADVFTGLGFAHAQDRLWQMEVVRIAAQGRLSELFGETTVDSDIWLRSMGLFEAAKSSYEMLPQETRDAVEAYTNGVNAWMARQGRTFASKLPPEFVILGHTPEPWEPEHSIAALKMMSVTLGKNASAEVMRLAFARLGFSSDEIEDLLPLLPGDEAPALPDLSALLELPSGPIEVSAGSEPSAGPVLALLDHRNKGASNNWVLSGSRTKSGQPILANDPHLSLSAPSIWYLAHLRVEGDGDARNFIGASTPGSPLILLGRSDKVAWGFTNTGSDVQDIFIEKTNPDNDDEYLTPDGWQSFTSQEEIIRIRGGGERRFMRRLTRHGPVLPPSYLNIGRYLPDNTVAALQWVALAADDTTMDSGIQVLSAATVDEFQAAMADYVTPMQSMVVADTSGNIGLIIPGRVPIRDPRNAVMGRAPVPGWDSLYDWKGSIPFEGLPRENNPPGGAIGTANTKIVGPDYPYLLTLDWEEPWRQKRVDQLIVDNRTPQTIAMTHDAQADVLSLAFAELAPEMIALIDGRDGIDGDVLAELKSWNYDMVRDSSAPLVFMAWFRESMIGVFRDDLGPSFDHWFKARANVMLNVLNGETKREWCDDVSTIGKESCADVLAAALNRALVDLQQRYGEDRAKWSWGEAHLSAGAHTPFTQIEPLNRLFDVQVPSAGGPFTLDRGVTRLNKDKTPFINASGSSFRGIYDFEDLDRSTFIQTTGQSGNPFSKHYRDFAVPWSNVEAITIPADPMLYEPGIVGVWRLSP